MEAFTVPRDAIINMLGNNVIFAVSESKAKMIPVRIIGYEGVLAGIQAEGLTEGMKVIIKGNERLRDGQPVEIKE